MFKSAIGIAGVIATGTFGFGLMAGTAFAADIDAGCMPAVSAVNGKIEGAGGYHEDEAGSGARFQGIASLSMPLGCLFGLQVDAGGGSLDGDGFGGLGGHLFMRDPASYLLGVHAEYFDVDGNDIFRIGPEAELYLGDLTLSAMAGLEDANDFNSNDFVAQLQAAFYIDENFKLYGGYRHFLSVDAAAIGFEYQPDFMPGSLFVDAAVGSDDYAVVLGGLRFYFGGDDKSLKARHREDDPGPFFNLLTRPAEDCVQREVDIPLDDGASPNFCGRPPKQ